jgi:hypothetical protein
MSTSTNADVDSFIDANRAQGPSTHWVGMHHADVVGLGQKKFCISVKKFARHNHCRRRLMPTSTRFLPRTVQKAQVHMPSTVHRAAMHHADVVGLAIKKYYRL